ncbi:MAG: hypothetical protein ABIC96_04460 [Patescibacteria group bacterium]
MNKRSAFFFYYSLIMVTVLTVGVFFLAPVPFNFFLALIFGPIVGYFWVSASQMRQSVPHKKVQDTTQEVVENTPPPLIFKKTKTRIIYASLIVTFTFLVAFFMLTILKNLSTSSIKYVLGVQTETTSQIQKLEEEIKALQKTTESQKTALAEIQQLRQDLTQLQQNMQENKKTTESLTGYDTSLLFPTIDFSPTPAATGIITINSNKLQSVNVLQDKVSSSKVIGQAIYGVNYEFLKKEGNYYYIILSSSTKGWIDSQFVKEINSDTIQNP